MNTTGRKGWLVGLLAIGLCGPVFSAMSNLIVNSEFRDGGSPVPSGWDYYTTQHGRIAPTNLMGAPCVQLMTQDKMNAFQGLVQKVPVEGGGKYTFSAQVLNSREKPLTGSAYIQVVVEWLSEGDREVGRTWSDRFGVTLSRIHSSRIMLQKVEAPRDAISAKVGVHLFDGDRKGGGAILIQEVQCLAP
jgi:hypothetical protein